MWGRGTGRDRIWKEERDRYRMSTREGRGGEGGRDGRERGEGERGREGGKERRDVEKERGKK